MESCEKSNLPPESKELQQEKTIKNISFPDGNNFLLQEKRNLESNTEEYSCYLKDKNGKILIDFQKLLAPGFKFYHSPYIDDRIDHRTKEVQIGQWQKTRDILGLLHEIGHSHQKDLFSKLYELQYKLEKIDGALTKIKTALSFNSNRQELYQQKEDLDKKYKWVLQDKIEIGAKVERGAWAWALKKVRQIRDKKGINLLAGFKDFQELEQYIHYCLGTYEKGALLDSENRLKDFFTYRKINRMPE